MNILVRLPNWLGDGVMFTPTFEILRNRFHGARFIFVGSEASCGLFAEESQVECFVDRSKKSKNRLFYLYSLALKLKKIFGSFDLGITFSNHFYSAWLLYCIRPKISIGYTGFMRYFLLTHPLKKSRKKDVSTVYDCSDKQMICFDSSSKHQVLNYAFLLSPLESGSVPPEYKITLSNLLPPALCLPYKKQLRTWEKPRLGIAPGAAFGSSKMWPVEYFSCVAMFFLKQGFEVWLFGGAKEACINQEIIRIIKLHLINTDSIFDFSNKTDIPKLCKKISALDVFLSNDSGPMHIACALNIPLVAIFGPTHPTYCRPWKCKKAKIMNLHISCSPCQKKVCKFEHHGCMRGIKPDAVIRGILQMLTGE